MNTYKITNITNLSGKRDFKHNSSLDITYVDNMTTKKITIKAGESIYLTAKTLPLSARKLRVKNLITVVEVSDREINDLMNQIPVEKKISKPAPQKRPTPKKMVKSITKSED